ncbi:MAG: glycosyltransferase [Solirubrobacteraceae bacterium]
MHAEQLTVVIPSRGRPEILTQTLDALSAQTVSGFSTVVVLDGLGQERPRGSWEGVRFLEQEHAGPGVARNLGVESSSGELILFLGDDMIPSSRLVEFHLARHRDEAGAEVAVLGDVRWHPSVAGGRIERWLEFSGAQFDYRQLRREAAGGAAEAGFGRFYSCNVSLKRALFERTGGFDAVFVFDYEDLDLGWRLSELGMRLRYEPRALALHLHRQSLEGVRARYAAHARGEWAMACKHAWFKPWFHAAVSGYERNPRTSGVWPYLVDLVPARARLRSAREFVEQRADSWYHQAIAEEFMGAWEGERGLDELREYLGERFELSKLYRHNLEVEAEAATVGDEAAFYRTSEAYLYDLTAFAMSGTKDPYRRELQALVPAGARLLDYGCGIGSDGLRLLERGYRVEFADFDNPSVAFLRWRLARRGLSTAIHDLDGSVPGGFDLAYSFDVIEHVDDPFAFLRSLEQRASVVVVNLLEPVAGETPLHRELPIKQLLRHASERGLILHRMYHGRSHLIAYRSSSTGS